MIILAITLTAWAIFRHYARKPARRATSEVCYQPVLSAAELQRREKERERAAKEAEMARAKAARGAEKERKATAERQQAVADSEFYVEQIDKLYEMLWEVEAELDKARETCKHDNEMNQHGAVVAEKIVNKHRADRDKLARKVMQLENAIHAKETKLNKAQYIVQAGA